MWICNTNYINDGKKIYYFGEDMPENYNPPKSYVDQYIVRGKKNKKIEKKDKKGDE